MNYDHLSDLPDWDDDEFKDEDEEGEELGMREIWSRDRICIKRDNHHTQ